MDRLLFHHGLENGVKSVMVKRIRETYQKKALEIGQLSHFLICNSAHFFYLGKV